MGFVVTTDPEECLRDFCKSYKIKTRKNIETAVCFDLKGNGDLFYLDDKPSCKDDSEGPKILLEASLNEAVYLARLIKKTENCNAVRLAWPSGTGVILENKSLIASIPSDGYREMSRIIARDKILSLDCTEEDADKLTEEEADKLLEEEGWAYDNAVDVRNWLQ